MLESIGAMWDNVTEALGKIKDVIFGFADIIANIFSFVPEPFSTILNVAVIIVVALVILKFVRG